MVKNYELFNISDSGKKRHNNEDYYAAFQNDNWLLLVLCDGMGGVEGGEIASQLAVKAIGEYFKKKFKEPISFFKNSVKFANEVILKRSSQKSHLAEMGTTLVALLFNGKEVYYAHVGDSRLYLFRNKQLKQLTHDHTYVGELVKRGVLNNNQAKNHQYKNRISRCIGYLNSEPEISTSAIPVEEGDIFLLCSDGLTDMVSDEKIAEILSSYRSLDNISQKLVNEANKNGGRDNITIQLLKIKKDGEPQADILTPKKTKNKVKIISILITLIGILFFGIFFAKKKTNMVENFKKITDNILPFTKTNQINYSKKAETFRDKEDIRNFAEFDSLIFFSQHTAESQKFLQNIKYFDDTIKVRTLFHKINTPLGIQKKNKKLYLILSSGCYIDSLEKDKSQNLIKYLKKHGFNNLFKTKPVDNSKRIISKTKKDTLKTNN